MSGFPFPAPILLVVTDFAVDATLAQSLEGTLVEPIAAWDDLSDLRPSYETCIVVCRFEDEHTRRELVDWINLEIAPRCRPGRPPIWL